jgi:membrane fusion protein (multidrug efflux system)
MADGRPSTRVTAPDDATPERANVRPLREPAPREPTPREPTPEAPPAPPAPEAPAAAPNRTRRRILLLLGPLVLIAAALYVYLAGGRYVSTDNAYVRADKVTVSTDVSGIVAEVAVRESQKVDKGQVLFRLDDEPYRIALAGAQAQLGSVRNEITTLQATYRQSLAQIEQARTDVPFYETTFARQQDLARRGAASQAALDQARRDLAAARDRVVVAQRQAEGALAQLGGTAEAPIEANPRFLQAQAQVDKAKRDLARTVVTAPMAGIVTNVDALQVGAYLQAGQAGFNLVASDHIWVEANPKETDLTYLRPGNPAEVTIDAYPERTWAASVASISPASGAEFSVLPAQNASGNWVKVVQRVPVRLRVEVASDAPPLRAGMSANVSIDTGHKRSLGDLVSGARHWAGL